MVCAIDKQNNFYAYHTGKGDSDKSDWTTKHDGIKTVNTAQQALQKNQDLSAIPQRDEDRYSDLPKIFLDGHKRVAITYTYKFSENKIKYRGLFGGRSGKVKKLNYKDAAGGYAYVLLA